MNAKGLHHSIARPKSTESQCNKLSAAYKDRLSRCINLRVTPSRLRRCRSRMIFCQRKQTVFLLSLRGFLRVMITNVEDSRIAVSVKAPNAALRGSTTRLPGLSLSRYEWVVKPFRRPAGAHVRGRRRQRQIVCMVSEGTRIFAAPACRDRGLLRPRVSCIHPCLSVRNVFVPWRSVEVILAGC